MGTDLILDEAREGASHQLQTLVPGKKRQRLESCLPTQRSPWFSKCCLLYKSLLHLLYPPQPEKFPLLKETHILPDVLGSQGTPGVCLGGKMAFCGTGRAGDGRRAKLG